MFFLECGGFMDVTRRQFLETIIGTGAVAATGCSVRRGVVVTPESPETNNLADRLERELLEDASKLKDTDYSKDNISLYVVTDPFMFVADKNDKSVGHYTKFVRIRGPHLEAEIGVVELYDNKGKYYIVTKGRGIKPVEVTLDSQPSPMFSFNGWDRLQNREININDYVYGLRRTLEFLRTFPKAVRK